MDPLAAKAKALYDVVDGDEGARTALLTTLASHPALFLAFAEVMNEVEARVAVERAHERSRMN